MASKIAVAVGSVHFENLTNRNATNDLHRYLDNGQFDQGMSLSGRCVC